MARLNQRFVNALRPNADDKDAVIFDDALPGFGVRVKPTGAVSWIIQYRNAHGRSRRFTLAPYGRGEAKLTAAQARKRAKLMLGTAREDDPAAAKRAVRGAITVNQLCDEYLKLGANQIKASTLLVDKSRIERHVKPLLGTLPVASLKPADMEKFVHDVQTGKTATGAARGTHASERKPGGQTTGGPAVAARTLGMLATILQRAVRDGIIDKNPARGIARPRDNARKPKFSFDRVATLGTSLRLAEKEGENQTGMRAIRFLLLSGCRRMEALALQWGTVDFEGHCLRFEDTKSGTQIRPMGMAALKLLSDIRPDGARPADYVFTSASRRGHFVGLPRVWKRICRRAKIDDVNIHGLRHWFASAAAGLQYSEFVIAGLLGHRVKGVTARYATAPDSALLAAADNVSVTLAAHLGRTDDASASAIGARKGTEA